MAETTIPQAASEQETNEVTREAERYVAPAVDIAETEHGLEVVADLPGIDAETIEVHTEKNVLTIKALPPKASTEREYAWREFKPTAYFRQFTLGSKIDQSGIKADYNQGVLYVTLPFAEESKPRQVKVKVG